MGPGACGCRAAAQHPRLTSGSSPGGARGRKPTADITFDILNLLNDTAAEAIQSDNLFASTFGQATQFMDPRRAMIGVRLRLGK